MLINLIPPKNSLKNMVINLLLQNSQSNGLSVNEIKSRIKRLYGKNISYQGIYKILILFEKENIASLNNKVWSVKIDWVNSVKETISKYVLKNDVINYTEGMKSASLETVDDAFNFFLDYLKSKQANNPTNEYSQKIKEDKRLFICHLKNIALIIPNEDEKKIIQQFAKNNECHILIENNTFVNKFCANYLKELGMKVYLGIPRSTPQIIILYDDELLNVFFHFDIINYLTKRYSKIKLFSNPKDLHFFDSEKHKKNGKIVFTFENDKIVVERTKNHFMKLMKKQN